MFGEVGVAKATLDEIADRAGVSKGTIYLYFPNKEELFKQTIRFALTSKASEPAAHSHATATRQLLDTSFRYWQVLTSEMGLTVSRLVSAEQWQFPELGELYATEVVLRFEGELQKIIERGIEGGEFRAMDPALAARMLTALTMQSASWANERVVTMAAKSSGEVFRDLTEFYLRAIAPEDAAFAQADGAPAQRGALNN